MQKLLRMCVKHDSPFRHLQKGLKLFFVLKKLTDATEILLKDPTE